MKALCGKDIKTEKVQRTVEEQSNLGFEIPQLTLTWIKARVGHEGSELADETAKQGALEPTMSVKVDIPISKTEISNRLKEQIYSKWHLRWTTNPEYKHSKFFLCKPDTNRAKRIL